MQFPYRCNAVRFASFILYGSNCTAIHTASTGKWHVIQTEIYFRVPLVRFLFY
ncbi:unnamed protein product, partial [Staurois parvus]